MVMEAPPRWRECDRFIYCRVNVAKALIAGFPRFNGCSSRDDDLERFIAATRKEPGGRVEPLPEVRPYESFVYSANSLRSPFTPGRNISNRGSARPNAGAGPGTRSSTLTAGLGGRVEGYAAHAAPHSGPAGRPNPTSFTGFTASLGAYVFEPQIRTGPDEFPHHFDTARVLNDFDTHPARAQ